VDLHLLAGLSEEDRRRVLTLMGRHRYRAGEVVFHEGDSAESVHFIVEGRVMVRRVTPTGERAAFAIMGPGEAFGELAMLSPGTRRSSTVQALEPTATLTLRFTVFDQLSRQHPSVNRLLVDVLAARVQRLSEHLLDALYAPVDQRVAHRLYELCRLYVSDSTGAVDLPLTQTELAEMAGASRPATNRVLRELAQRGVVELARGRIRVPDVRALRRAG
jgi:CRP-like cAMP-binding protein